VGALGRGRYRRHDERTATQLGNGGGSGVGRLGGDLRRLHQAATADRTVAGGAERLLQRGRTRPPLLHLRRAHDANA